MEMNDHDILIEMKTILKGVVDDFRSFRKDNHDEMIRIAAKVQELEKNKLSIVTFDEHQRNEDLRFSKLERAYWMAAGVIALLQFLVPIILKVWHIA